MSKDVKVYTTPSCPWCKRTKKFLEENAIPFQEINVAFDRAGRDALVKRSGQLGVPVIEIESEIVIGFDEAKLREKLGLASS